MRLFSPVETIVAEFPEIFSLHLSLLALPRHGVSAITTKPYLASWKRIIQSHVLPHVHPEGVLVLHVSREEESRSSQQIDGLFQVSTFLWEGGGGGGVFHTKWPHGSSSPVTVWAQLTCLCKQDDIAICSITLMSAESLRASGAPARPKQHDKGRLIPHRSMMKKIPCIILNRL
jgi:hypothetical protein